MPIGIWRDPIGPIQLCQPPLHLRCVKVTGAVHVQRMEYVFLHVIFKTLAGSLLNHRRDDGWTGIAVSHACTRRPTAHARRCPIIAFWSSGMEWGPLLVSTPTARNTLSPSASK